MTNPEISRVHIGISSCLLGEKVRFDGGHKKDEFLTSHFGRFVEWVPVCPEFEIGLGVPRESLRLVSDGKAVHLVAPRSGLDHTERMRQWTIEQARRLADQQLCGYVLKRSSPSCGLERVKVYSSGSDLLNREGRGLFAAGLVDTFPNLPMEEEGRLNDARLRENFVSQVFCYKRWTDLQNQGLTRARIMQFHARHKYLLMAHHQDGMRKLGNLIGGSARSSSPKRIGAEYFAAFCDVMRRTPTRRNHTNVLQHLAGYFSEQLASDDRAELSEVIDRYRREQLPLIVPVTLIRHYVRKFDIEYLKDQIYLDPHPDELNLLNQL
ncbi:MAG TPA: DUF523 and DUF1722 domain-containing protein [Terriglobia bacterium]|nr:DUF523 and DUF1722 domain-containing protein [Terriglobia bacterium]